ncbi:YceI family protein [Luteimonas vadosa]|uniref:YceI family protein n=1 Tax=Luteimonas vadosa TaxID=1165507 RepID=UPI003CD0A87B
MVPTVIVVASLLAIAGARAAGAETYALDPVHTRVQFAVDHAGFSKALGTVSGSSGVLRFDPEDWGTAMLRADIPLSRLDLGDEKWNRATMARNLLDVENHPVARFVSTRVQPLSPGRACVFGDLRLRGVTREVVLDVRLNGLGRHPLPPFRRTVGFSATTTLSRSDFGITAWQSVIGDRVDLRIEAEATRSRARLDTSGDEGGEGDRVDDDHIAGTGAGGSPPTDPAPSPMDVAAPGLTGAPQTADAGRGQEPPCS